MLTMFKQFKFKLFIRIYISYVCVFIIPFIVVSVFLSQYVMSAYENEVSSLCLSVTNHISSVMDKNLYNIEKAANILTKSNNVLQLAGSDSFSDFESVYYLKLLSSELSLHQIYQESINSVHLFYGCTQTVITTSNKYTLSQYFDRVFANTDYTFTTVSSILNSGDSAIIISCDENALSKQLVTILRPLFKDLSGNYVTLISTIQTDSVFETFSAMTSNLPNSCFVIADNASPLIKSAGTPEDLNYTRILAVDEYAFLYAGEQYVTLHSKSISPGLNYIYVFSESQILLNVNRISFSLTVIILAISFALLILAYVVSNRSFYPLSVIISNSAENEARYKLDSYKDIKTLVTDTLITNNSLRTVVDKQKKCINDNLFKMLLQNSMDMDKSALDILFSDSQSELNNPFFHVIIINIINYGKIPPGVARLTAVNSARTALAAEKISIVLIPNDQNQIILLASHKNIGIRFNELCKRVASSLKTNYGMDVSVCVGRQFDNLSLFSKSYEDALYSKTINKSGLISSSDYINSTSLHNTFLTHEDRNYLVNKTTTGNTAAVFDFFDALMTRLFIENTLTYRLLSYLRYSLCDTLSEIAVSCNATKILDDCRPALAGHDYMECFKVISNCFIALASHFAEVKSTPNESLREMLLRYIGENYQDPTISLRTIAEELHFSYSYLYKFFKKEIGCVFLDYLRRLRFEKAKELLSKTDLSVADISGKIGYLSSNTFIKTFKKFEGITPGEFKKNKRARGD